MITIVGMSFEVAIDGTTFEIPYDLSTPSGELRHDVALDPTTQGSRVSEFPTDREYEQVALIDARGGQHTLADRSTAGVVEQLKEQARKVGADAIIIRSTEGGNFNWGQGGWDRAKADAVAIRYVGNYE